MGKHFSKQHQILLYQVTIINLDTFNNNYLIKKLEKDAIEEKKKYASQFNYVKDKSPHNKTSKKIEIPFKKKSTIPKSHISHLNKTYQILEGATSAPIISKFTSKMRKFPLREENLRLIDYNPLLYEADLNPLRLSEESEILDTKKIMDCKNLALKENKKIVLKDNLERGDPPIKKYTDYLSKLKSSRNKRGGEEKLKRNPLNFFKGFTPFSELEEENKKGSARNCLLI